MKTVYSMSKEIQVKQLAAEVNSFMWDIDPYDYNNDVGNDGNLFKTVQECINDIEIQILDSNIGLSDMLQAFIDDGLNTDDEVIAGDLINRISKLNQGVII